MSGGTRALTWPAADKDAVIVELEREQGPVLIVNFVVVIQIFYLGEARLDAFSFRSFGKVIPLLPHAVKDKPVVHQDGLSQKPPVQDIILAVAVEFQDFVPVEGNIGISAPGKRVLLNVYAAQADFNPFVTGSSDILGDLTNPMY